MFTVSMPSNLFKKIGLVLPERRYHVLSYMRLTKMETPNPRGLC